MSTINKQQLDRYNKEKQLTNVIMVVTTSFLISMAWQCITQCIYEAKYHLGRKHNLAFSLVDSAAAFVPLGVTLKSSINCMLYSLSSSLFRKQLAMVLCVSRRTKVRNFTSVYPSRMDSQTHIKRQFGALSAVTVAKCWENESKNVTHVSLPLPET